MTHTGFNYHLLTKTSHMVVSASGQEVEFFPQGRELAIGKQIVFHSMERKISEKSI